MLHLADHFKRRQISHHATLCCLFLFAMPLTAQTVLYDNGFDAETGYYAVNFGASTADSFVLPQSAVLTNCTFTIYDVDDRNQPAQVKWSITTEPFGGNLLGSGVADLSRLQTPYLTRFLFFAWVMSFQIPNLALPPGTYWIQMQDVTTRWDTWSFWAESGGSSRAYYLEMGPSTEVGLRGNSMATQAASEAFTIYGDWAETAQ